MAFKRGCAERDTVSFWISTQIDKGKTLTADLEIIKAVPQPAT
jgi:hypothetical protein